MLRRRHRHGPYPLASEAPRRRLIFWVCGAVATVLVLTWVGRFLLSAFDIGNTIQRAAAALTVAARGAVSITLDGGETRTAEGEIKLFPNDSVRTDRGATAVLRFFDGTVVRIDRGSEVTLLESAWGKKRSSIRFALSRGKAWVRTPEAIVFSGSVLRELASSAITADIPSGSEVVFTPSSAIVLSADGPGIGVRIEENSQSIVIGEGQQLVLPEDGAVTGDAYAYRSALLGSVALPAFVSESRDAVTLEREREDVAANPDILSIVEPTDGTTIKSATVLVTGMIGPGVDRVRINGYQASIDPSDHSYSLEIALADTEQPTITVEALSAEGDVLEKLNRLVRRDRTPPSKPVIVAPAKDGETYRTSKEELEIRGNAPAGTTAIIVNDYRLQLFSEGDRDWSYLASVKLQNFSAGENTFNVYALNAAGVRSDPAVLRITLGAGDEGVVGSTGSRSSSSAQSVDPTTLPKNDPLMPGVLRVTAPTEGTEHSAELQDTGTELLIEGSVPKETHSVWVNDYQLQLYSPGKTFFNYIASTKLNTLKRGSNPYVIIARNAEGKILDTLTYTIMLQTR